MPTKELREERHQLLVPHVDDGLHGFSKRVF